MFSMTIDGRPVSSETHFAVKDPASGAEVARCPIAGPRELDAAVDAATRAFGSWASSSDATRAAVVRAMADAIAAHAEELARLLTQEQGKPLNGMGSRFELGAAEAWARHTAELSLPPKILQDDDKARIELHRKPVGVVGSITPWNWPLMIAIWHVAPAIRTGNTVVIKPSPLTPLSTLRLVEILNGVLPPGVLNAVTGLDDLGPMMTAHAGIAKIVFTGSTPTGKNVMRSAADTLKRLTLELGGNDAGIVLADADPKAIAEGLFWGAFINNGQTCAALKRLYVHDAIYEQVCQALVDVAATVKTGPGLAEDSVLGPIQNQAQFNKVKGLVEQAVADGARVLTGGRPAEGSGYFYPVTILADARDDMAVVRTEQFGPVLPVIRYTDVEDALQRANNSESGLGGSVWSSDVGNARVLAARLECGTAWINKHGAIQPNAPFGGVKASGLGVEFASEGLEEYTTIQVVHQ